MESQFTKMSEALYYKLPNLCKVLKVNQARLGVKLMQDLYHPP